MNDSLSTTCIITVAIVVAFLSVYYRVKKSQAVLSQWARENGFDLIKSEFRLFRKGPFIWSSKHQVVFRVIAPDTQSRIRHGWVRCGSWWAGLLSDQAKARWNE